MKDPAQVRFKTQPRPQLRLRKLNPPPITLEELIIQAGHKRFRTFIDIYIDAHADLFQADPEGNMYALVSIYIRQRISNYQQKLADQARLRSRVPPTLVYRQEDFVGVMMELLAKSWIVLDELTQP